VPVIAEAWDAAGLYHVRAFPGMACAEWNGRARQQQRPHGASSHRAPPRSVAVLEALG
jgi:pullulanase/glycogen debranching enzyme